MAEFVQEADMVPRIQEASSPGRLFATEVPLFKRMVDLYAFERETSCTFAYELKLHDWKRGLTQVTPYLLAADFVYLAVPENVAQRVLSVQNVLVELGIGLIAVDGTVEELLPPRQSRRVLDKCREAALAHLKIQNAAREYLNAS